MSYLMKKVLSTTVLITCSFTLFGCSNAINPWYEKHPQKSQSFLKRKPIRDNAFIEDGGLAKKNKVNPFVSVDVASQMSKNGFYSNNPNLTTVNKKTGVYQNPLGEPYYMQQNKLQMQSKTKGEDSSITSFFKKLNIFKKSSSDTTSPSMTPLAPCPTEVNHAPTKIVTSYQTSSITSEQPRNKVVSIETDKRLPLGNQLAINENDMIGIEEKLYTEVEQGGGNDAGYSHYDLADNLGAAQNSKVGEMKLKTKVEPASEITIEIPNKKTTQVEEAFIDEPQDLAQIESSAISSEQKQEMIKPMQSENLVVMNAKMPTTDKVNLTIAEYADLEAKQQTAKKLQVQELREFSEFDSYYVEQNKKQPTLRTTVQEYFQKLSGVFNPVNKAYANESFSSADTQHASSESDGNNKLMNSTAEENTSPAPIITDQDMQEAYNNSPNLRDIPLAPEKFQKPEEYQKKLNELQEKN